MNRSADTFVIRLWQPGDGAPDPGPGPRGVARHVRSGREAAFRDGGELLALLRELPGPWMRPATDEADALPTSERGDRFRAPAGG